MGAARRMWEGKMTKTTSGGFSYRKKGASFCGRPESGWRRRAKLTEIQRKERGVEKIHVG